MLNPELGLSMLYAEAEDGHRIASDYEIRKDLIVKYVSQNSNQV